MSWTGSVELLNHLNSNAVVLLAGAFLLGVFFAYVYRQKRQAYLLVWAIAWLLASLPFALYAFGGQRIFPVWLDITNEWTMAAAALAFYCSARIYARMNISARNVVIVALLAGLWAYAYMQKWIAAPLGMGVAIIFFGAAQIFWHEGRKQESRADKLLALTFVATGILRLLLIFQDRLGPLAAVHLLPFALLAEIFGGVLMLMAVYEEERRRVERNMLALSNLNLATSSFVGGEIQKMLAQALERVLNVVRIPAGALCLHYGDEKGPTSIVVTGMGDTFCSAIQKTGLDAYTVNLVARLGGLVVLRDLARDANWVALEKEETFQHVRKILLEQGLRTVVGISLQAKERVFGVLLLGTPDNRNFTPPELRLLLALGHQIGMAVENSYLIQQTARRSEELHILNEIGRALSSTLEPDALFERIYSEMQRLLDVGSFFIAFHDKKTDQVRFEIEWSNGERLPKRTRPAGNHLTEYVIRTAQPLLIRDQFEEEAKAPRHRAARHAGSICAVPLILVRPGDRRDGGAQPAGTRF